MGNVTHENETSVDTEPQHPNTICLSRHPINHRVKPILKMPCFKIRKMKSKKMKPLDKTFKATKWKERIPSLRLFILYHTADVLLRCQQEEEMRGMLQKATVSAIQQCPGLCFSFLHLACFAWLPELSQPFLRRFFSKQDGL